MAIAIIGTLAILIAMISTLLWFIALLLKKDKFKSFIGKICVVCGLIFLGCGFITMIYQPNSGKTIESYNRSKAHNLSNKKSKKSKNRKRNQQNIKIYDVMVQSIFSNKKSFIISGKTMAPDGAKIYVRSIDDLNCAYSTVDEWAKVKNHQFKALVDIDDLTSQEVCPVGKRLDTQIFAVTNYTKECYDSPYDFVLKKKINEAKIKKTGFIVDDEMHNLMYKTEVERKVEDSFTDFYDLAKKDFKNFTLNGYKIALNKDKTMITVSLKIPIRWFDTFGYLPYIFRDIKKVNLDSYIKYIKMKYYESENDEHDKLVNKYRGSDLYLTAPTRRVNWFRVLNMANDDMEDFIVNYDKTALVKTYSKK